MPGYLLDTSALLVHFRKEAGWERVKAIFDEADASISIASVTLTELARRLVALGFGAEVAIEITDSYRMLLNSVVAVDEPIARTAFELGLKTPERLPMIDALIAASAQSRELVLVHRDRHLAAIPRELVLQLVLDS